MGHVATGFVVVIGVVASASLVALTSWLAYRDYLRRHRDFVEAILAKAPLGADAIAALAPAPPSIRSREPAARP